MTASARGQLKLWEASTGVLIAAWRGHRGVVMSCSFSPDSTKLLPASLDGTLKLWEASRGRGLATMSYPDDPMTSCVFSPDGAWVAAGTRDGAVICWDEAGLRCINPIGGGTVRACVFSPDGVWLGLRTFGGMLVLLRVEDGSLGGAVPDLRASHVLDLASRQRGLFLG